MLGEKPGVPVSVEAFQAIVKSVFFFFLSREEVNVNSICVMISNIQSIISLSFFFCSFPRFKIDDS